MTCYLRVAASPSVDTAALEVIINTPPRGLGEGGAAGRHHIPRTSSTRSHHGTDTAGPCYLAPRTRPAMLDPSDLGQPHFAIMKNRSNPIPPAGAKALERLREAARSAAASGSGSGTLAGLLLGDLRQAPLLPPDRLEAMLGHVQRNNGQLPPEALTVLPGRDLIISTPSTTPDCYTSPGRSRMRPRTSLSPIPLQTWGHSCPKPTA